MDKVQEDSPEVHITHYRDVILTIVWNNGGLKSNDLSLKVIASINPVKFSAEIYHNALDGLVIDRELVELPYVISGTTIKVGQIYFPKGTRFGTEFVP